MYNIIEKTNGLNAVTYDNNSDIRICICYVKNEIFAKDIAVRTFWKEFERLSINSNIVNGK